MGGHPRQGYAFLHSAIDAHSQLADSKIHADERATTAMTFCRRARAFFASYGITVERVLTDYGSRYRARTVTAELVKMTMPCETSVPEIASLRQPFRISVRNATTSSSSGATPADGSASSRASRVPAGKPMGIPVAVVHEDVTPELTPFTFSPRL